MNRIMANNTQDQTALIASFLRVGVGLLFVIGGLSKLSLLLNSTTHDGMVANYMGTEGYINTLFQAYLFSDGSLLTPSVFLKTLSAFELVSGFFLIVGFMVRPLALFYGFLLWSFVVALPVHTVPGVEVDVKTYTSPAIFVQIRDITLSGMMFVLFNLGAGVRSWITNYFLIRLRLAGSLWDYCCAFRWASRLLWVVSLEVSMRYLHLPRLSGCWPSSDCFLCLAIRPW
ncbi:DoxX family membrane protein [uncultured Endozoicomonas sp.]|uniref:DoxX family membrane protein n=1 Tax=uncultured Endozoicomonas sp. TaxID=432652 RepID=UPI00261C2755|nr:DoxX family membrane protein [uncultured Endozoicomonas sp.]